jgi:hypothetical protein
VAEDGLGGELFQPTLRDRRDKRLARPGTSVDRHHPGEKITRRSGPRRVRELTNGDTCLDVSGTQFYRICGTAVDTKDGCV